MDQTNNMNTDNVDVEVLLPILKQIPLFSGLLEDQHREIIRRIILMYYPSNYTLFNENEAGDALYIIKTGSVRIFHPSKEEGEEPEKVAQIREHGFFGEMALISDAPRNASAITETDCEIFILSKEDFKQLLDSNQVMAEQISATVISRIKDNEK